MKIYKKVGLNGLAVGLVEISSLVGLERLREAPIDRLPVDVLIHLSVEREVTLAIARKERASFSHTPAKVEFVLHGYTGEWTSLPNGYLFGISHDDPNRVSKLKIAGWTVERPK